MKYWIVITTLTILLISSCRSKPPMEGLFEKIVDKSPAVLIEEYKNLSLDSAIILYHKYPEIFEQAAEEVLIDSLYLEAFDHFIIESDLRNNDVQAGRTIGAYFHKWLNNEEVNIEQLKKYVGDVMIRYRNTQ